ncbi:exo-alpha-sialidase [Allofournierella sp.]|uniref:exo-alpha-sialidase n=1 Tax=Allofournierella sp. TaxID=1940256 RepID=UPI003AB8E26E
MIYSDDNGRTWAHGESVSSIYGLSEAAPVEMPDGSLKLFLRNTSILGGTVVEATSTDGGQSWRDVKCTFSNNSAGINCQLSAIRLSGTVRSQKDGQEYPAMLLSSANLKDRTHGRIFVGLLKENGAYPGGAKKYTVDWEYQYDVTPQGTLFAYSCLAELSDGRVALLYESSPNSSWDDGLRMTYYREFDRQTLLG